jgi:phosphoribosylglycinamide formyltransferase 2
MQIGTPGQTGATRLMLLGAGELGKEVVIEAQRFGVEVVAVDRYADAPAMQVAHRAHVIDMLDAAALRALVEQERPDLIVPEIEAIHTPTLLELEAEGFTVIPTARTTRLTMDREGIRRLAAEAAGAWDYAQSGGRAGAGRCIVEGFVDFDYEITLLTVRHAGGTLFCDPIGHRQEDGDYRESWQPQPMSDAALARSKEIALGITDALGGRGLFGVELFVKGDDVLFSEVSPRPHDTGLVTLVSQDLSEFALHVRAVLGLPIPGLVQRGPSASAVVLVEGDGQAPAFAGLDAALAEPGTELRLFGKPEVKGRRRMGVALARGATIDEARARARASADAVRAVTVAGAPWPPGD